MFQRILIPLDGSPLSESALEPAAQLVSALAPETSRALRLLRVVDIPPSYGKFRSGVDSHYDAEIRAEVRQEDEQYLKAVVGRFSAGDLAQWMTAANLVVMIDASHAGEPGELCIRPLSQPLSAQPSALGTHYTTPEELAALTAAVYGRCPPVVVVSVTGADFSIGEQLSAIVARRLALVSASVRQICANAL